MGSLKRPLGDVVQGTNGHDEAGPSTKKVVHPFFSKDTQGPIGTVLPSPPTLYHYINNDPFAHTSVSPASAPPVASTSSNGGESSSSTSTSRLKIPISFYDLDGTLIRPKRGGTWPKDRHDWTWWNAKVVAKLRKEVDEGRHVIVISNQGAEAPKTRGEWKAKVPLIAAAIPDIPIRVLAAFSKIDVYRKPNIGMFQIVEQIYKDKGFLIDMNQSFYVGDAAGRVENKKARIPKDHSDTDYKWAINVGLKFFTPEEHFLHLPHPTFPEPPNGFRPAKLGAFASLPPVVPSNTPIARNASSSSPPEIILFIGPPASGKTSFFQRHFLPHGYRHINQDTLKSRDRCLAVASEALSNGFKVVIDNTNRNVATREYWVKLAEDKQVGIRVFHFTCPRELAVHNNIYRALYGPLPKEGEGPKRELLPPSAIYSFFNQFEMPSLKEGFDEIRSVNFVWEGGEEQRKLWDMYLS